LLVLARRQPTSLKEKPVKMHPMLYSIVRLHTESAIAILSSQISRFTYSCLGRRQKNQ
jgi:hypothetical protein